MCILIAAGLFAVIVVSGYIGIVVGEAFNYHIFSRNAFAIYGTLIAFGACITVAVLSGAASLSWVFASLASLIFGVMVRGAAE